MMRLRADITHANAARGGAQRAIAECGFSVETGLWTYKMLRPDKVGLGCGVLVFWCFGVWGALLLSMAWRDGGTDETLKHAPNL